MKVILNKTIKGSYYLTINAEDVEEEFQLTQVRAQALASGGFTEFGGISHIVNFGGVDETFDTQLVLKVKGCE